MFNLSNYATYILGIKSLLERRYISLDRDSCENNQFQRGLQQMDPFRRRIDHCNRVTDILCKK